MDEDREDRIQRALNESKKRELEERYGADFSSDESKPPEIESRFLQNIEEFEQQFRNARRLTVRQFVGNPAFKGLAEIPPGDLEPELNTVVEYLALHNVQIDFLSDVSNEERYRFMTGELLDEETDDIRIDGMQHHFIYEEFHPNDEYDATMFAEDFLHFLMDGNVKLVMNTFCKDEIMDPAGAHTTLTVVEHEIRAFTERVMTFVEKSIVPAGCEVEGDYAMTRFDVSWDGLMAASLKRETFSGVATIRMKRSPYTGWDVVQASVPGWNA